MNTKLKTAILLAALTVLVGAAPMLAFAVQAYEEGHFSGIGGDHISAIVRDPAVDQQVCPGFGEPHIEIEVTSAEGGSLHVCGDPDDLRTWGSIFLDAADAAEAP